MFSRRTFLCGATAVTMSTPAFLTALRSRAYAASNTILVVVELNGGNDAFNMVIPWDTTGNGIYSAARANIAIQSAAVLAAGSNFDPTPSATGSGTTFAFNPTMSSTTATNNMRWLYSQGKVALIMGLGLPANAVSRDGHQQAQFYWQTAGVNNLGTTNLGWVGQGFDQIGATGTLPPMVTLDGSNQVAFHGAKTSPLVVGGDLSGFTPNYPSSLSGNNSNLNFGPTGIPAGLVALNANNSYVTAAPPAEYTRAIGGQTTSYVAAISQIASAQPLSDYVLTLNGTSTTSGMKSQFKQVARMILGGASTRAYYVRQSGYDNHSAQNAAQPGLLGEFSQSVTEFYTYLKAKNASSNVVIMTISDFGRRAYSNATAGTDHGTATMHFMIGDPVKGGTYFNSGAQGVMSTGYPNITTTALDNNGNVYVSIDYRYYISASLQWLGADPTPIVGASYVKTAAASANLNAILPGLS